MNAIPILLEYATCLLKHQLPYSNNHGLLRYIMWLHVTYFIIFPISASVQRHNIVVSPLGCDVKRSTVVSPLGCDVKRIVVSPLGCDVKRSIMVSTSLSSLHFHGYGIPALPEYSMIPLHYLVAFLHLSLNLDTNNTLFTCIIPYLAVGCKYTGYKSCMGGAWN